MMIVRTLFLVLAAVASWTAQAGVNIQHWTTAGGARVYFVESRALPILDVNVAFPAGGAYAPPAKAGLAGLTRALLAHGTGELNEEQIAGRWVDLGARFSGGADSDSASVSLRTLSSAAERNGSLALLHTLLTAPTFPADIVEREKARAIASLKEAETRPETIAGERFSQAMYPNHPYGVIASVDSLASIGRDDLVAFHRSNYLANTAVVSIIGDVSRAEAESIAEALCQGLPAGAAPAPLPPVQLPDAATLRIDHPATQAHILVGVPGYARGDADTFPLQVGNYVLGGGGFVSQLVHEVREKRGLAYDVHSYFEPRLRQGPFEIGLQTKRGQAGEALKLVDDTLAAFLKNGPTAAELHAAKQHLADGFALRLDSNAKLMGWVSMVAFYQLPLTWIDDYPRNVEAVTADQVRAAFARRIRPEHLVTVIVAGG
jgi:zinc protease